MIKYQITETKEAPSINEIPKGAKILSVDGREFIGICGFKGCKGWMLSTSYVSCKCDTCGKTHDMIDDLI